MPLLSSTPETRRVPSAGGQFRERRLIRGVGAKERAVGYAYGQDHLYGGMSSKQRAAYGSQRNYARAMEEKAAQRAQQQIQDEAQRQTQQGYADGAGLASAAPEPVTDSDSSPAVAKPSAPPVNHADSVLKSPYAQARMKAYTDNEVEKDMFPTGRPKPKDINLAESIRGGRIADPSMNLKFGYPAGAFQNSQKGANNAVAAAEAQGDYDSDEEKTAKRRQWQQDAMKRHRMRGQFPLG